MKKVNSGDVVKLSTGIHVKASIIGALLIDEVQASVPEVPVPIVDGAENPLDPNYNLAVQKRIEDISKLSVEVMIESCLELCDADGNEIEPPRGKWIAKLKRRGIEFDEDDPLELELAYLKYKAVGARDVELITSLSGLSEEELAKAEATFQRPEARNSHKGVPTKHKKKG